MILKLLALEQQYFWFGWNLFDMFIVISADVGIVLDLLEMSKSFSTAVTILRAFRIMRVVRILGKIQCVRVIIQAVFQILPNIGNVMSLFVLVLFIYACVGINLFAKIKERDVLNDKFNFQTFGNSMVTLMKFATGDDWSAFMIEATLKDDCEGSQTYEDLAADGPLGCGTTLAIPFFLSFQVIVSMLILNLTVAAVIDGLQQATAEDERLIKQTDVDKLMALWSSFDPSGTKRLTMNQFFFFLAELPHPFCVSEKKIIEEYSGDAETHLRERFWIYLDTIHACPYERDGKNKRIRKVLMLKIIRDLKIQTCKGTNRYDKTIYINFGEIYKLLIKRVFAAGNVNKEDYKITNKAIKDKIDEGWILNGGQTQVKKKKSKKKDTKDGKTIVKKEKDLIYKCLAVSIIEDAAKLRMKQSVEEKKTAYQDFLKTKKGEQKKETEALLSGQDSDSPTVVAEKNRQYKNDQKQMLKVQVKNSIPPSPILLSDLTQSGQVGMVQIIDDKRTIRLQETPSTPVNQKKQSQLRSSDQINSYQKSSTLQPTSSYQKSLPTVNQMTQVFENTFDWQNQIQEQAIESEFIIPAPGDNIGDYSKFLSDSFGSADINEGMLIQNAYFRTEDHSDQIQTKKLKGRKSSKVRKSKASRKKQISKSPIGRVYNQNSNMIRRESITQHQRTPSDIYGLNSGGIFDYQTVVERERRSNLRSKSKSAMGSPRKQNEIQAIKAVRTKIQKSTKIQKNSTQHFLEQFPTITGTKSSKTLKARKESKNSRDPYPILKNDHLQPQNLREITSIRNLYSVTPKSYKTQKGSGDKPKKLNLKFPSILKSVLPQNRQVAQTQRLEAFISGPMEELKVQSPERNLTNNRGPSSTAAQVRNSRSISSRPRATRSKKKVKKETKGKQPTQGKSSRRPSQIPNGMQYEEAKEGGELL